MRVGKLMLAGNMSPAVELPRMNIEEDGTPELVAQKVRSSFQLVDSPISDLTATLEEAGIVIVQYRFGSRRLDAVSEWIPGHPPIIPMNVNESVPGDRYRWTLAHELGHLIMHRHPSKDIEDEANQFAAEFLMPAKKLRSKLRNVRMHTLATLKTIWKVFNGSVA